MAGFIDLALEGRRDILDMVLAINRMEHEAFHLHVAIRRSRDEREQVSLIADGGLAKPI
jgi:uncharacterized protein with von Willebrand factor type A (vWA) domain